VLKEKPKKSMKKVLIYPPENSIRKSQLQTKSLVLLKVITKTKDQEDSLEMSTRLEKQLQPLPPLPPPPLQLKLSRK